MNEIVPSFLSEISFYDRSLSDLFHWISVLTVQVKTVHTMNLRSISLFIIPPTVKYQTNDVTNI